jgi:hypothetical protein
MKADGQYASTVPERERKRLILATWNREGCSDRIGEEKAWKFGLAGYERKCDGKRR